jgi:hypothetical protein
VCQEIRSVSDCHVGGCRAKAARLLLFVQLSPLSHRIPNNNNSSRLVTYHFVVLGMKERLR